MCTLMCLLIFNSDIYRCIVYVRIAVICIEFAIYCTFPPLSTCFVIEKCWFLWPFSKQQQHVIHPTSVGFYLYMFYCECHNSYRWIYSVLQLSCTNIFMFSFLHWGFELQRQYYFAKKHFVLVHTGWILQTMYTK